MELLRHLIGLSWHTQPPGPILSCASNSAGSSAAGLGHSCHQYSALRAPLVHGGAQLLAQPHGKHILRGVPISMQSLNAPLRCTEQRLRCAVGSAERPGRHVAW